MTMAQTHYRYRITRWRLRRQFRIAKLALRYAIGSLSQEDANQIIYDCQTRAGWWPLCTFDIEGTLECALDLYEDHPRLREFVEEACERVAHKWCGDGGETAGAAQDWALDLLPDYARQAGVELKELCADG